MESKILERLLPLWDITSAVEQLIDENKELEEENKKLKQRVDELEKIGVSEVIVGKAIYEKRITLNQLKSWINR